jgi:hypothetical protein
LAISECLGQPCTDAATLIENRPVSVRDVALSATPAMPGDPGPTDQHQPSAHPAPSLFPRNRGMGDCVM